MNWNYRVVFDKSKSTYSIYSAYYNELGEIVSMSTEPAALEAETIEELLNELNRFKRALEMPTLDGILD